MTSVAFYNPNRPQSRTQELEALAETRIVDLINLFDCVYDEVEIPTGDSATDRSIQVREHQFFVCIGKYYYVNIKEEIKLDQAHYQKYSSI